MGPLVVFGTSQNSASKVEPETATDRGRVLRKWLVSLVITHKGDLSPW